jgi:predicted DNA-binding protein (MmcQ/YjbR family)
MHKKYWNSVTVDNELSRDLLVELIDHSYDLVVSKMTKKKQAELKSI